MQYAVCNMQYAVCRMQYAVCMSHCLSDRVVSKEKSKSSSSKLCHFQKVPYLILFKIRLSINILLKISSSADDIYVYRIGILIHFHFGQHFADIFNGCMVYHDEFVLFSEDSLILR